MNSWLAAFCQFAASPQNENPTLCRCSISSSIMVLKPKFEKHSLTKTLQKVLFLLFLTAFDALLYIKQTEGRASPVYATQGTA